MKAELRKNYSDPVSLTTVNELPGVENLIGKSAHTLDLLHSVLSRQPAVLLQQGVVTLRHERTSLCHILTDRKTINVCDLPHQTIPNHLRENRDSADDILR